MRIIIAATAALALALSVASVQAAETKPAAAKPAASKQCRDDKGKFIKCVTAAPATTKCRDKTSKKFAKCDAPNTEPLPAK
ncbi:MAG: hypothetical protein EOO40_06315 [Deltaproteobacteria bacterium]|nr:MAG: hypothetical protein EOO40_06315 [Deltaproteobacteria bacterium]